jgi:hypothetical protein
MSHTSSAVFAITVFATPVVALGVVLATTGGAPRRTVARAASIAATACSVLIAAALLTDLPRNPAINAVATVIVLAFMPVIPWLLLRDEQPGETQLVLSLLVSGALVGAFALVGLVSTFAGTVAESTSIGAGPAGLFVLIPAGAYVALEVKVFRAVRGMMKDIEAEAAARAAAARAHEPVTASPTDAKLRVRFEGCEEIQSGSPYHSCKLRLDGEWTPSLPTDGWIRISAFSPDRRYTGLAHWDKVDNAPGFRIITIDCVERSYEISDRSEGFCQSLAWSEVKFVPLVWHAPQR